MCTAFRILLLVASLISLGACEGASVATPAPETITIGGATAMRRVLQDLATEFSRQHPNVLFVLRGGGSTLGEEAVRRREIDLAASTLLPPDGAHGVPTPASDKALVRTPIGLDGLAIVVHPSNVVAGLSLVQLRDIFGGRVLDWQALGSDAGEILLVSREDGSGSRILFEHRVMDQERVSLTAVVMPTSADVVAYVAKNPAAIGYVTRGEVAEWVDGGSGTLGADAPSTTATPAAPLVRVLRLEGLLPAIENLRNQQYALTQPLYLISNGPATGRVREFIDFVLSPAGQAIVARYHAPIR
jgi:phosphate transport system substrate-binding protein